ncbi:MAG: YfhO family protein, partial [Oscillospiraceae bacterium]|nr:YfhO family protein [Oscillospiraceae bacterium]
FGVSTIVAVMLSAFMILPVYNALQLGKFDFTKNPDYSFAVQFEPVDILAQLLTCQYDSVNVQGSPEIYCGILTVVLLPLFFLNEKISLQKKFGHGFLLIAMFFSMYIKPVDMWWHGGQVPNWLPYRYSFIISFILLSMAATTFKNLDSIKLKHLGGVFFGILAVILYIQGRGYEHLDIMNAIWLSIGLAGAYLLFLYAFRTREGGKLLSILLIAAVSVELVYNSVRTLQAVDKEVAYSSKASYETFVDSGRKAVNVMEDIDDGLYRSEKTFSRCINDNMAFGLKGLTHSSSVMNDKCLSFIATLGYNTRSYYSRYEGTTELGDSILGIKYVLDRGDNPARSLLHNAYTKVGQYDYEDKDDLDVDGNPVAKTISIYENPNALPIAYMVNDDLLRIDHLGNDNPFNSQNVLLSTMLGNTTFDSDGNISGTSAYYTRIDVGEPVLGAVTLGDYNGQACYTRMESGDPTVDYRFTVESSDEIFCFLKTENEQQVNLWLGTYNEETENYDFKGYGQYFETHNYSIISLGSFEPGTQVSLRLTVLEKDNATIIKEPFFYYFNRDVFQNDIVQLKNIPLEISKYKDNYNKGNV